jgi:hypothetical protein
MYNPDCSHLHKIKGTCKFADALLVHGSPLVDLGGLGLILPLLRLLGVL